MTDFLKDHASRSAAADAINNGDITEGSVFAADGRLYRYGNEGTAFNDLNVSGVRPVGESTFDHYGDNDNDRISRSIDALNAGEVTSLTGSGNTYDIDNTPPLLTAHNFEILGKQSMIRTSASDARVFRVGDVNNFVRRAVVDGFTINSTNVNATGACIEVENATDILFNNIDPNNVPQYLHIGGDAKSAAVTVQGGRGSWRSANDLSPIFLEAGSVVKLSDLEIHSPDAASTARCILVRPKHIMDTIEVENCKIYARDGIGGGVDVDLSDFSVTNIWLTGNTFDRCVHSCVRIYANGDLNNWSKHLRLKDNYMRCMGGYLIDINNAGSKADIEAFNIANNTLGAVGKGILRVRKTNADPSAQIRSLLMFGNTINDDIQYVDEITRESDAVIKMSVLNGFALGDNVRLGGFTGPLDGLNQQTYQVSEILPDLKSVRLAGCDTSLIPTGGNDAGRICRTRGAHLMIGIPGARVMANEFTARVDSVPLNVTTAAVHLIDGVPVTEVANDLLTPSRFLL